MEQKKTIMIAAGGTGGHIFPALAIANKLSAEYNIIWLGGKNGMEQEIVKDYPIFSINAVGIRGKSLKHLISAPLKIFSAIINSYKIINNNKVVLVIGFGGFVGGFGGLAAWLSRVKFFIHEQNSIAGTTNKYLNKIANKTFTAFDGVLKNAITCGNPIGWQKLEKNKPPSSELSILVLGGSLGAKAINEVIPQLTNIKAKIYHQCGQKNFASTKKLYDSINGALYDVELIPFIDNIEQYYSKVDLVVCRAGAMTISELIYTKTVAILIPLPWAIDNHQFYNAKILTNKNCAFLLEQKDLNRVNLSKIINSLNNEKIKSMQDNFLGFTNFDTTAIIREHVKEVI